MGLAINVCGYIIFLGLLEIGVEPKIGSTALFLISVLLSFWVNRNFVFKAETDFKKGIWRTIITYSAALTLNILIIFVFVDLSGMHPEYVQIFSAILISIFLFFANKSFVHKPNA